MKSVNNLIHLKHMVLVVLSMTSLLLFGQGKPQIDIQFANPKYDSDTRTYTVDVELMSMIEPEILFAMNLRFFYDASLLQYKGIDQFHQGYGFLGEAPKAIVGGQSSGAVLFDFGNNAGYINGTVILVNEPFPLHILTDRWTKAFRVKFKVPLITYTNGHFCPGIIWDKEFDPSDGGFLPGSEGILISVVENDPATPFDAIVAHTYGYPFNWEYFSTAGMPYGHLVSATCIPLTQTQLTQEQDKSLVEGYEIWQNAPNPFGAETTIQFTLPSTQNATIVLYDIEGVIRETIDGHYEAGKNTIVLHKKNWMAESGIIYYRLQTEKYVSRAIPMTIVKV